MKIQEQNTTSAAHLAAGAFPEAAHRVPRESISLALFLSPLGGKSEARYPLNAPLLSGCPDTLTSQVQVPLEPVYDLEASTTSLEALFEIPAQFAFDLFVKIPAQPIFFSEILFQPEDVLDSFHLFSW